MNTKYVYFLLLLYPMLVSSSQVYKQVSPYETTNYTEYQGEACIDKDQNRFFMTKKNTTPIAFYIAFKDKTGTFLRSTSIPKEYKTQDDNLILYLSPHRYYQLPEHLI